MKSIIFYELPKGDYWDGLARLVSHVTRRGKSVVLVSNLDEASCLSKSLWNMSHGEMVPHGTVGIDADEDLDPVIIAAPSYDGPRKILILSSLSDVEQVSTETSIVEPVPQDTKKKQHRRARYRRYREAGFHPEFVSYEKWTRD